VRKSHILVNKFHYPGLPLLLANPLPPLRWRLLRRQRRHMRLPPGGPVARPCDRARDTRYDWKKGGKSDRTYQFPAAKTSELKASIEYGGRKPFTLHCGGGGREARGRLHRAGNGGSRRKGTRGGGAPRVLRRRRGRWGRTEGQAEGRLLGVEAVVQPRL